MRYVDLRVVLPDELLSPMQRFIREEDVVDYEELLAWNVVPSRGIEYELFYVEADRDPYEAQVEAVESIREYRVAPVEPGCFHVYACSEIRAEVSQWRQAFADLDLLVVPPIAFDEAAGLRMTIVGASEDVQSMLDSLPTGIEVEVESIGSYERRRGLAAGLTARQREAVEAAVELGYYEVPRDAELADVADELDCTGGTASELLRRAESAAVAAIVDRRRPR